MNTTLNILGMNAKKASATLLSVSQKTINSTLNRAAELLRENVAELIESNKLDINNSVKKGKNAAFIDRLTLNEKVIDGIAEGLKQVAELTSPVGKTTYTFDNKIQGIHIEKRNVPFGVIGIIFESRPNVTADAFALCFKTGNAVILRGGSDSINSNMTIVKLLKRALAENGVDENAVSLVEDTSRETATEFMRLNGLVDLIIPRGGASLIKTALKEATVPIIETGLGNCHVYVDKYADLDKSVNVIFNAKTQRYGVCNACESLVIHSEIYEKVLPLIAESLKAKKVEMRCDKKAYAQIKEYPYVAHATEEDFFTEYGDAIISVKIVEDLEEAIAFINEHGTGHSDAIMTENDEEAAKFLERVDSAVVYRNASTRFSDGFVFGLGAEIGISTQKLHARGPMGLEALVTTKYFVTGNGAVRK